MGLSAQARETKAKPNKWDGIKPKSFCTAKETGYRTKRPPPGEWAKILDDDISEKGFISKIYKGLISLDIKTNKQLKGWAEDLSSHFSEDGMQTANRHSLASLIIRAVQIKATRWHLTAVRRAVIKKTRCGGKRTLVHSW